MIGDPAYNLDIIDLLVAGFIPDRGFRHATSGGTVVCCGHDYTEKLPATAEIHRRRWDAREAAIEAKKREYAARPVDDAAWQNELQRRASVTAWLNGARDRFQTLL